MAAVAYGVTGAEMGLARTAVKTSAYTASPADLVPADISGSSWTMKLPSAPADGTRVAVKVVATTPASQFTLTVACQGADVLNKAGGSTTATLPLLSQGSIYSYQASTAIWTVTSDDLPLGSVKTLIPAWVNVLLYGADPTGAMDSQPAFAAAIAALPATGGVVYVPAGTYRVNSTITVSLANNATVTIQGDGMQATLLNWHGTGDCIRMHDPTAYTSNANIAWRSGVVGLTVDGTSAGSGSAGLHVGDIGVLRIDACFRNFSGTGGIGLHLDNTVTWTEEADIRATLINCTSHLVAEVTTGYNSYGYGNWDITIFAVTNQQDGVVFKNGAMFYHGSLRIRGDFLGGASTTTAAALRLTGVCPGGSPTSGKVSQIVASRLDIQLECNTGTFSPASIVIDQVNFAFINACYGILDFGYGAGAFAGAQYLDTLLQFAGIVNGDTSLAPNGSGGMLPGVWRNVNAPVVYSQGAGTSFSLFQLNFPTALADMFTQVLGGNWTVTLNFSGVNNSDTLGAPQRVTIILKQPPSGTTTNTVTWPHAGSPSVSSPTVKWAGGTAPTMTTGANATDVYYLETIDGATWYGRATQNVS